MDTYDLEYAVVGAGCAGTYAAWRLATAGRRGITVFEAGERVGGRLHSVTLPGMGGVRKAELGGMRYLTSQTIVTALVPLLRTDPGLPAAQQAQFESVPFQVESNSNLLYLRGETLRDRDLADPAKVPYRLNTLEQGRGPNALMSYAVNSLVPNATYLDDRQWQDVMRTTTIGGVPLTDLGFWNVLGRILSEEAYAFVLDGQGYNSIVNNWNAATAMPWVEADVAPGVTYTSIKGGFDSLPQALLTLACDAGVTHEQRRLAGWTPEGKGGVRLRFTTGPTVTAENLILAMPRTSLEALDLPTGADRLADLIPSVNPQPMFKLFLAYHHPWWRELGLKAGRTISDLPLRQTYYWGSNYDGFFDPSPAESGGVPNEPENSMIMATYTDVRDETFWAALVEPLERRHGKAEVGIMDGASPELSEVVATVQDQLRTVHGLRWIPEPYAMAYANWAGWPFGGGWNSWRPGVRPWEVAEQVRRPVPGQNVFVCGEAYSVLKQGWVEGALETAERVLRTDLAEPLGPPAWLPSASG